MEEIEIACSLTKLIQDIGWGVLVIGGLLIVIWHGARRFFREEE